MLCQSDNVPSQTTSPRCFLMKIGFRFGYRYRFVFKQFVINFSENFKFQLELELGMGLGLKLEWLKGVSKTLRGLCMLHCSYRGGFAPSIRKVQTTQAPPEFLTLPQVIPTSIPIPILIPIQIPKQKNEKVVSHAYISRPTYRSCWQSFPRLLTAFRHN